MLGVANSFKKTANKNTSDKPTKILRTTSFSVITLTEVNIGSKSTPNNQYRSNPFPVFLS